MVIVLKTNYLISPKVFIIHAIYIRCFNLAVVRCTTDFSYAIKIVVQIRKSTLFYLDILQIINNLRITENIIIYTKNIDNNQYFLYEKGDYNLKRQLCCSRLNVTR